MAGVLLVALAIGAFACGATLGDGAEQARPSVAETLPADQLAGQRIVTGLAGTSIPARLREAIHAGHVAGVVLFAENFPSRAAGRRLIARLQAIPRPPGGRAVRRHRAGAVAGARAGADILLYARLGPAERAREALVAKLRAGGLNRAEFEAAAQRVLDLRAGLAH